MAQQKIYDGRPTAKLTLFALWDDGFDDTDSALAEELSITLSTIRSYRVEWKRERGDGVKKVKQIYHVAQEDVPFETIKGIVWCVPKKKDKLKCERCEIRVECQRWMCIGVEMGCGAYLGCEEVYECELLDDG